MPLTKESDASNFVKVFFRHGQYFHNGSQSGFVSKLSSIEADGPTESQENPLFKCS
jgi:hypothetical protein